MKTTCYIDVKVTKSGPGAQAGETLVLIPSEATEAVKQGWADPCNRVRVKFLKNTANPHHTAHVGEEQLHGPHRAAQFVRNGVAELVCECPKWLALKAEHEATLASTDLEENEST